MKKLITACVLLTLVIGFVPAEDLGLAVGAEYWIDPIKSNHNKRNPGVGPFAEFEKSIKDLDIYLKGQYDFLFTDSSLQALYLEEMLAYNFSAGGGKFTLAVDNYNMFGVALDQSPNYYYMHDDWIYSKEDDITGYFEPSLAYAMKAGSGELSFGAGFPIGYLPSEETYNEIRPFIGFETGGAGFDFAVFINLSKKPDMGSDESWDDLYKVDAKLFYEQESTFRLEVRGEFRKNSEGKFFKNTIITPRFEISPKALGNITIWVGLPFAVVDKTASQVGEDESGFGVLAGAKLSF
jgi:hypothetical protein